MRANGEGTGTSVWPTAMAAFVILALIVSGVSLGGVIHKSNARVVVGAGGSGAVSATPAFDFGADPPDSFVGRDPMAPVVPSGTVHKVTFDIIEKQVQIAPGVTQLMWTYNGEVPGPILRGRLGDTFEITVVNRSRQAHSIDIHASKVAPDVTMRVILPGQSLLYKFTADHSGIFMYHCGTALVLEHIGMGMCGAIIIDPPNLAPVAHEYVIVQSELYRESDPTQPGDYAKLLNEQWQRRPSRRRSTAVRYRTRSR